MHHDLANLIQQDIPSWWPNWHDETCVIVAGGPSAAGHDYELLRMHDARVIVINNAHRLVPFADVLFACDLAWWKRYGPDLAFGGLRLSTDRNCCEPRMHWGVQPVGLNKQSDRLDLVRFNHVGWGGNSGFQALNLAIQFGASRIVLVGYDMTTVQGLHWHGAHPSGMNNPTEQNIARWRRAIDGAAEDMRKIGVTVINASEISTLQNYPKMSLAEAIVG
ncbi:hypothetical protein [Rhizobium sp. SYY.PMSO]|uniref:hypothetical protein n=1 Tax=Rhizobium sp. SYY.PMSO TaxID=3382192 RepID=UPI00398FE96E